MTPSIFETIFYALMLSSAAGAPLLMLFLCCTPLRMKVMQILPLATVPALLIALTVPDDVSVEAGWFFMSGRMGLDGTGRIFLILAGFVWLLASFSILSFFKSDHNRTRFHIFFLTAMAGNFGLILAQGMFGYYLFFAMMSFASYGLVAHEGHKDARRAGRIYLFLVMIGEMALFTALLCLVQTCNSMALSDLAGASYHPVIFILLFIGFGIKIGALPFHGWLIPAYQNAPAPAATALAGSMVNAGILGWLRFMPLGQISYPDGAILFIIAGALAAIYGVIAGLNSKQPGAVLGGSSISQMGLITVVFGMGLLNQDAGIYAIPVLILYVVHHSLAKSSLFFSYDLTTREGKIVSHFQLAAILFTALALAGMPFTSGAIAKTAFKELATHLGEPWYGLSTFFLPITAMGTTILMLHFVRILKNMNTIPKSGNILIQLVFVASFTAVATTLWIWPFADDFSSHSLEREQIFQGSLPVAAGCFLFFLLQRSVLTTKFQTGTPKRKNLFDTFKCLATDLVQKKRKENQPQNMFAGSINRLVPYLRKIEKVMGRWQVVGLSYLALCFCLLFLLL